MTDANNTLDNLVSVEASNRNPLTVTLIGTPGGVTYGIRTFAKIGYAKVSEWSPLSRAHKPGLVKCSLTRYIPKREIGVE